MSTFESGPQHPGRLQAGNHPDQVHPLGPGQQEHPGLEGGQHPLGSGEPHADGAALLHRGLVLAEPSEIDI